MGVKSEPKSVLTLGRTKDNSAERLMSWHDHFKNWRRRIDIKSGLSVRDPRPVTGENAGENAEMLLNNVERIGELQKNFV